jgi:hypothetical protein
VGGGERPVTTTRAGDFDAILLGEMGKVPAGGMGGSGH